MFACNQQPANQKEISTNPLQGNWNFLDKYGNYNEAYFGDSTYKTINKYFKEELAFKYFVKNDSLYSNLDKRKKGMSALAGLKFLSHDSVIISTEFVRDTLSRIKDYKLTLQNTNPFMDSVNFFQAFEKRYENLLISKGIITAEEAREFHEKQTIPQDVIKKRSGQ